MTALHQYISAIGSFQGLLLFLLLACDRHTTAASKVLGLFSLCMGLAFFLPFITFGVASEVFNPLAVWLFFLPVTFGPLLYLYCRKVVFNAPLKIGDLAHALPLLACYLLNLDALVVHHEAFRLWIVGSAAPTQRVWLSEYLLFGIALAYLIATGFVLKRYQRQASDTLSNFDPAIFTWLRILIFSFAIIWVSKAVMAFTNVATLEMLLLSDAFIVLMIYGIALAQWKNPEFFSIKHADGDEQALTRPADAENIVTPPSPETKATGTIDHGTRAAIFDEVKRHIEQERAYRDSALSLSKLADAIGLSPHQLSETLNQHAGQNFNHFINAYRVREVCEQLDADNSVTVLDVALQAGFASKSTFNTIFKKFTGVTPTQYRQQRQA